MRCTVLLVLLFLICCGPSDRPVVPGQLTGPESDLAMLVGSDGIRNVVVRDSDAWRQLTHFTEGEIFNYDVSPDHTRLIIARGEVLRDIVLIENFR